MRFGRVPFRAGFTLIEIVMVMALMGLIVAIAVPRLDFSRIRVNGAVRSVVGLMAMAQRQAVTLQNNVNVVFDTDRQAITIHEDVDNDNLMDAGERTRSYMLGEGIVYGRGGAPRRLYDAVDVSFNDHQQASKPELIFRRDGSASEGGGIYITTLRATRQATPADARSIEVVRATGRAEWYRYDGTTWRRAF